MDEGTSDRMMTVRPVGLNAAIAWLFIVGSAPFVLGSVPAYADVVGATADGITYFVGSIFFTAASFAQLLQALLRPTTDVDTDSEYARVPVRLWAWLPMIEISLLPHSVPARCSSMSARSQRSYAMPRWNSRTGASGGRTPTGGRCS